MSKEAQSRRWKLIGHVLRLKCCNNVVPRREEKKRKAKNYMEMDCREREKGGGWKMWNEVQAVEAKRAKWRNTVEVLCNT